MRDFEETGDIVVDVCRLQARAVMRLGKVKATNERGQEHLQEAVEYLKLAGELLTEWDERRIDDEADDQALAMIVERHVERILQRDAFASANATEMTPDGC